MITAGQPHAGQSHDDGHVYIQAPTLTELKGGTKFLALLALGAALILAASVVALVGVRR